MKKKLIIVLLIISVLAMLGATGRALYYKEDEVHVTGDRGMIAMAVRNDTIAALAGTDGDYAPLQVDANGNLYITGGGGESVYLDDADWTNTTSSHTLTGGIYQSTPQTITDGDTGPIQVDANGNQVITGTVTANAGTNLNTSALALDTSVDGLEAAIEGAEDELDGTTTTGPLAKIAHTAKALTLAKIDVDLTGGGDSGAIIALASSEVIYVVELLIMVDAQCQLQFTDGSETASTSGIEFPLPAFGGVHLKRDPGYRFALDSGEMMSLDDIDSGTVEVRGYVWFYQE